MLQFRTINYGLMLYDSLRNYFAVNAAGNMSIMYKYLSAFVAPFQTPFNNLDTFRKQESFIAGCKWQIGQVTNLLNYIFDSVSNRIYISQSTTIILSDPQFAYAADHYDSDFGTTPEQFERGFNDISSKTDLIINIPASLNIQNANIIAVINQVILAGISYSINYF